jgi:hypothetical protein
MCQLFSVLHLSKIVSEVRICTGPMGIVIKGVRICTGPMGIVIRGVRICTGPMGILIRIDAQGSLSPYWLWKSYRGVGKSLARPGTKQATAT